MDKIILLNIFLSFSFAKAAQLQQYDVFYSLNASEYIDPLWVVSSSNPNNKLSCLVECNMNPSCVSALYTSNPFLSNICILYKKYLVSNEVNSLSQSDLYYKSCMDTTTINDTRCLFKEHRFLDMSLKYQHRFKIKTYSGFSFVELHGVEELFDGISSSFYVFDKSGRVIKFNEKWEYVSFASFGLVVYGRSIGRELIVVCDNAIYKTNQNLTVLKTYTTTGAVYRGICFNKTNSLIYVVSELRKTIELFDRNLTFIESIPLSYTPFTINEYNNILYVGTNNGRVLIVQNRITTTVYTTPCGQFMIGILFDIYGYMSTLCFNGNAYIFHLNGTYTSKTLSSTIFSNSMGMVIDRRGRLAITSYTEVNILY